MWRRLVREVNKEGVIAAYNNVIAMFSLFRTVIQIIDCIQVLHSAFTLFGVVDE